CPIGKTKHRLYLFNRTSPEFGCRSPQLISQPPCDFHKRRSHGRSLIFTYNRHPAIPSFPRGDVNRYFPKQGDTEPLRFARTAAAAENIISFTVAGTNEIA